MKWFVSRAVILIVVWSAAGLLSAQTDPFVGTWKLNVKKSKFVPGPPVKNEIRIIAPGLAVSVECVNSDSSTQEFEYTATLDGTRHWIVGPGPYGANSVATDLTAFNTIQSTFSKDNRMVATATSIVSSGGKVLTITTKGADAHGKPFTIIAVYDKQ